MASSSDSNSIIGFYASFITGDSDADAFRAYLWADNGLKARLGSLQWMSYGKDLRLLLFQFYVRPIPFERGHLREIENYRPKEKSIGIPVVIDDDNFFRLPESQRLEFFTHIILKKLDLVSQKVKRNGLDCDIAKLKVDVERHLRSQETPPNTALEPTPTAP